MILIICFLRNSWNVKMITTFCYKDIARKQPHRVIFDPLMHLRVKDLIVRYFPNRALCFQTAGLLVVPRVSESRMGGRAFSYQAPLCVTSFLFGFRKQTPSLPFRLGLKLSFLTKLIVRDGSRDPETTHSYAAIGLDYWRTSHDAPFRSLCVHYCRH